MKEIYKKQRLCAVLEGEQKKEHKVAVMIFADFLIPNSSLSWDQWTFGLQVLQHNLSGKFMWGSVSSTQSILG